MRFILRATLSVDAGNDFVKSGAKMQETLDKVMADVRPEAAYFSVDQGQRTIFMVVNVDDASDLPRVIEPWWLAFKANVDVLPTMSQEDMGKAMETIAELAPRYS